MKIKSFLLLLLAVAALTACKKGNKTLDPNAKVSIQGVRSLTKADAETLPEGGIAGTGLIDSLEYITKYAVDIRMTEDGRPGYRWIGAEPDTYTMMRDFEAFKIKFWAADAISSDGQTVGGLVANCDDMVVIAVKDKDGKAIHPLELDMTQYNELVHDTVAYIPNAAILEARAKITAAFNAGDYESCYQIFDNTYIFLPTTGEKWRAMKAAGIE